MPSTRYCVYEFGMSTKFFKKSVAPVRGLCRGADANLCKTRFNSGVEGLEYADSSRARKHVATVFAVKRNIIAHRRSSELSEIGTLYIDEAFRSLRGHKRLADDAIAQLSDEQFFAVPDVESNSVAIIVKHMAGNMRSRFTDFLTTDGEKPDRNRDQEFIIPAGATRAEILAMWEQYWQLVFETLNGIGPEDLERTVTIRGEPHTVLRAINRQVAHYAYHVGQIVFLAKHWKGSEWKTLSVARGKSEEVNAKMLAKLKKP